MIMLTNINTHAMYRLRFIGHKIGVYHVNSKKKAW